MCLLVRVISVRVAIRPVHLSGSDLHDRDQVQAEITHVMQQAIQRGLIDHRASEDGCSIACVAEAQAFGGAGRVGIKVSIAVALVPSGLVLSSVETCGSRMLCRVHLPPVFTARRRRLIRPYRFMW